CVLAGTTGERRLTSAVSRILDAFALSERVVREHDVTLAREIREQLLVARPRLAGRRMPERGQNRGMTPLRRRQIEVRSAIQPRPAFERELLDAIAGSIDTPGDTRIERRPLQRAAEHLPPLLGHAPLALLDGLRRGDRVDLLLPPLPRFVCDAHEIPLEIVRVIGERRILDAEVDA